MRGSEKNGKSLNDWRWKKKWGREKLMRESSWMRKTSYANNWIKVGGSKTWRSKEWRMLQIGSREKKKKWGERSQSIRKCRGWRRSKRESKWRRLQGTRAHAKRSIGRGPLLIGVWAAETAGADTFRVHRCSNSTRTQWQSHRTSRRSPVLRAEERDSWARRSLRMLRSRGQESWTRISMDPGQPPTTTTFILWWGSLLQPRERKLLLRLGRRSQWAKPRSAWNQRGAKLSSERRPGKTIRECTFYFMTCIVNL